MAAFVYRKTQALGKIQFIGGPKGFTICRRNEYGIVNLNKKGMVKYTLLYREFLLRLTARAITQDNFDASLMKICDARFQRPPGALPSSMLGYEALTGSLDDFGFEDYLNMPQVSATFRQPDMHHGMEVRLGLSKGPICPSFN
ncbi:hypothetical protein EJB05_40194 [Eragrostis curvula]|uniref:Uncharacterized protein n=1 Tax=Eragrostis curvula TaxID=38414 RepID=A0A5J9U0W4_9POAL|nr:hypothetical protein EJB05_40194 [Eragrostis curvula]